MFQMTEEEYKINFYYSVQCHVVMDSKLGRLSAEARL